MVNRKIPRTMSTQHPDNVNIPFFSESSILKGDEEVREAYYAYSHLGCDEQMWDYEGKDVDVYVVKKLLSRYSQFFYNNTLGKDVFLTFRIPNPSVERGEAKIALEVLESIPRSYDCAKIFYGKEHIPVFEVILPMTSSHFELERIYQYYLRFVVGKAKMLVADITVEEWTGKFKPEKIDVIPLFEDKNYVLNCDSIIKKFISDKELEYFRVFLAKSDLAMNYGGFSSNVYLKTALYKLKLLEKETGIEIYPIVGFGSPPFRGNLRPENAKEIAKDWREVYTLTIQSAFKYDCPEKKVVKGIEDIKSIKPSLKRAKEVEELEIANRYSECYRKSVVKLVDVVNAMSVHVPRRRARKLHIGLFGYSREVNGIILPRAIPFCCSLYSLGIPPELIGLGLLEDKYLSELLELYRDEVEFALRFFSKNVCEKLGFSEIYGWKKLEEFGFEVDNFELAKEIYDAFRKNRINLLSEKILQSAKLRGFLG